LSNWEIYEYVTRSICFKCQRMCASKIGGYFETAAF
jgi:hypothetical protein